MRRPRRPHHVGVLARAHEDPAHDLAVVAAGGVVHDVGHLAHVVGRQPVDDRPVGLAAGEAQHALAQGGDEDRRLLLGPDARAGSPGPRTCRTPWSPSRRRARRAGSARRRAPSCTARSKGTPFHRSTITLLLEPMPIANRPGAASASDGHRLGEARRGAGVGGHDRRAEAQARFPRRSQRQRGEGVGTVGLGRPDVGVAEVGELGSFSRWVWRWPGQRHGHARSDRHGAIGSP